MRGIHQTFFNNKARSCFYLRLAIIANLIVLAAIFILSPIAESAIQAKPLEQYQEALAGLSSKASQQKKEAYQQQEALLKQLSLLQAKKPTPHLISLVKQLIQQEADIQDFIHAKQQATYSMAKLVDAQEWSYSKTKNLGNYINSSRQRQIVLRKILKSLNTLQGKQSHDVQHHLKMNKQNPAELHKETASGQ